MSDLRLTLSDCLKKNNKPPPFFFLGYLSYLYERNYSHILIAGFQGYLYVGKFHIGQELEIIVAIFINHLRDNPLCNWCNEIKYGEHYFFYCNNYRNERRVSFRNSKTFNHLT